MNPLNLLHIVRRYGPVGGMERYVWELTNELAELGHEVTVICEASKVDSAPDNIEVIELGSVRTRPRWLAHLRFSRKVSRWIGDNPDSTRVIHSHERTAVHHVTTFHGPLFAGVKNKPLWQRCSLRIYANLWLEKREICGFQVKAVIPNSTLTADALKHYYPCAENYLTPAIAPGVSERILPRPQHAVAGAGGVVGFIGKEWKRKGLDIAVQIVAELKKHRPGLKFLVAGPQPKEVEHLFRSWDGGFRLMGEINSATFFSHLDLLLHPARQEPYGMVIAEARAAGVPVLVSDACGISCELDEKFVLGLTSKPSIWAQRCASLFDAQVDSDIRSWQLVAEDHMVIYRKEVLPYLDMKPVILISMNVAPVGGVGADMLKCVRALCSQGREIHVIYGFMDSRTMDAFPDRQVHWHRICMPKRPPVIAQLFIWATGSYIVSKILKKSTNAVTICFERLPIGNTQIGCAPNSLWMEARKRLNLSIYSKIPYRFWNKSMDLLLRRVYKGKIVLFSERDRARFIIEGGAPDKVLRLIIPTDMERFSPDPNHEKNFITIIGINSSNKGIDIALEAWKKIGHRFNELTLRIVTHANSVKRLVDSARCPQVEMADFIPKVEDYYHSSRLVLIPSMYETWGNVLPEALACGIPVVSSTDVPSSEIISRTFLGIKFERDGIHDVERLAHAMESALQLDLSPASMTARHLHVKQYMRDNPDLVEWMMSQ